MITDKKEQRAIALPIITAGTENGATADEMKQDMMVAGIPFSALNGLLKSVSIEEGLMVDPKTVTEEVNTKVEACDWESVADWEALEALATQIADATEGATVARVVTLARAYCKNEMDLTLPKKPRTGGGGSGRVGAIALAVCELFAVNPTPTKQEFYDAMVPVVGGDQQHANIIYYMGLHLSVGTAIATGRPLADVTKELASQINPKPGEGVSAVPRGGAAEAEEIAEESGDFDAEAEEEDFA